MFHKYFKAAAFSSLFGAFVYSFTVPGLSLTVPAALGVAFLLASKAITVDA